MSMEDLHAVVIEMMEERPELASMSSGFPILRIQREGKRETRGSCLSFFQVSMML